MKPTAYPTLIVDIDVASPKLTRPDSTYKSGSPVQTNGAIFIEHWTFMLTRCIAIICIAAFAGRVAAEAEKPPLSAATSYPARPVRLICPFPPGGAADMVARMLAQRFTDQLREQVVVDNRSGAGGVIGVQIAAKSPADGHTLLLASSSNFTFGPAVEAKLPYDPARDFMPVALTVIVPNILTAHPGLPAHSIGELIRLAKESPGKFSYASPGTGTTSHLIGVMFERAARIQLLHIPYKGGGPALVDLMGGHVQLLFGGISTSLPLIRSGKLLGLGVTTMKRSQAAPGIPTIAESGLPGFEVIQWFGLAAPVATPRDIVARLNRLTIETLNNAEFKTQLYRTGLDTADDNTPAEFDVYMKKELGKLTRVFKEAGVHIEQVR